MSRPKVAFFDFTSCEGCQLSKLNLEDDLLGILGLVEIVNFREAISDRGEDYEIAFVEGSISTPHCVERIHKIRRQAKILVALGACAHIAGVNAIRNRMNIDQVKEEVYGKDKYLFPSIKAQAVADVVKVDYFVPGLPHGQPGAQEGPLRHPHRQAAVHPRLRGVRGVQGAGERVPVRLRHRLHGTRHARRMRRGLPVQRALLLRMPGRGP